MMRKTAYIYLPMLSLLLAGCMAEVIDTSPQAGEPDITVGTAPISLMTEVDGQQEEGDSLRAGTRTTNTALQSTQFASGETIYVYFPTDVTVGTTTSASYTTYTTDGSGHTTPTTQPYMNSNIPTVDIHAYYPSTHSQNTSSFSVQADQTGDANYKASDLMYANTSVTKTAAATVTGSLTFSHRMAKIIVEATADTDKGVSAVTRVRLIGGYRTATISMPLSCTMKTDGGFSDPLSTSSAVTLYDNATGEASVSCAGLIPPQTIAEGTAFLEVTVKTAGDLTGTATYSLPAAKTFASGNAYTCTLSINLSSIGTTTAITNWGNGGSTSLNNNGTPTLQ